MTKQIEMTIPLAQSWFEDRYTRPGIWSEVATITPEIAEQMLTANGGNRRIIRHNYAKIKDEIASGNWKVNGVPIIVSSCGKLNDGQHRLLACVETGVSFQTLVTFGVTRHSRDTVDLGSARRVSDMLQIAGVLNANAQAAVASLLLSFEAVSGRGFALNSWSFHTILERIDKDPTVNQSANWSSLLPHSSRKIASKSLLALWHNLMLNLGPVGIEYVTAVGYGFGLGPRDPAHIVRERLLSMSRDGTKFVKTEAFLRGWVAHREGRKLSMVKILGELPLI